jgi:F-type H+-transporting ATPase subunit epsilon
MLQLEIVTPEAKVYSESIDSVVIPGVEGELGILNQHVPLLTQISPGELRVSKDGKETNLAVGEGFVEVTADRVIVLTDMAIEEANIDADAAEEAVRRAEQAMAGEKLSDEEYAATAAALQRSLAMVRVKRRRQV